MLMNVTIKNPVGYTLKIHVTLLCILQIAIQDQDYLSWKKKSCHSYQQSDFSHVTYPVWIKPPTETGWYI